MLRVDDCPGSKKFMTVMPFAFQQAVHIVLLTERCDLNFFVAGERTRYHSIDCCLIPVCRDDNTYHCQWQSVLQCIPLDLIDLFLL